MLVAAVLGLRRAFQTNRARNRSRSTKQERCARLVHEAGDGAAAPEKQDAGGRWGRGRSGRWGDGAEEIRSRPGPGHELDEQLDKLKEAAPLVPAGDRRGGSE